MFRPVSSRVSLGKRSPCFVLTHSGVGLSLIQVSQVSCLVGLLFPLFPDKIALDMRVCCLGLACPPPPPFASYSKLSNPSLKFTPPMVLVPFMSRQQLEEIVRVPQRDTEDIAGARAHHALVLFRSPHSAAGLVDHGVDASSEGGPNRPADACSCAKDR